MSGQYPTFEIVITAIVVNSDGKYLITRRSMSKKRFPGFWTVPGGHLEPEDYLSSSKETEHYWYNVLEKALVREIREEVGIEIENIRYVTSLATTHKDGVPSLVISCLADYVSGEVKLQEDETDKSEWVNLDEAKNYNLLDGIYDELVMAENFLKTGKMGDWKRH